jgi:oleandomycin transport system permease protein
MNRVLSHTFTVARRNLMQIKGDPDQLMDATVMPIMFVLLFVYVFGGAVSGSSHAYLQFVIPGVMIQMAAFASARTGTGLNLDFDRGIVDRFRSLPIARSAVLSGRILADTARSVLALAVILGFGAVLGFRVRTGFVPTLGAVLVALAMSVALSWVSALIGVALRSPEAVQQAAFLWLIPFTFGSSIFAPPSTMPGWLQAWQKVNPVSLAADATRALLLGGPTARPLLEALAATAALIIVFAPLSVQRYRSRT